MTGPITVHTPGGQAVTPPFSVLNNLAAVAWSGTRFLAVGEHGTALTSASGAGWTPQATGTDPLLVNLTSAAWIGGTFIAGGTNGYFLTSGDGATWTLRPSGLGGITWNGIASSGSQIVAAGSAAYVARSTDGSSWTTAANTPSDLYNAIARGNGLFVVTGFAILTSPDGVTWTTRVGQGTPSYGVAWSGSTFAAVGSGGAVRTSPDGVTWTARTSGTSADLRGVTWAGDKFVAVGDAGTILTSPDGVTWTARTSGVAVKLSGVAASSTTVVAVGDRQTIVTSADGVTWASNLPPPPTGLTVTGARYADSTVSWDPVAGATSYVVYASSGAVSKTSYAYRFTSSGTSLTASIPIPTNGTYWNFIVTSVDGAGEGPASPAVAHCLGQYICP
jgi:hypothetical protein